MNRWVAQGLLGAVVVLLGATAAARPDTPDRAEVASAEAMLGLSPCAFFPEPPPPGHPIRRGPFAGAFRLLDGANRLPKASAKAVAAFVRARDALLVEASGAFTARSDDPTEFNPSAAQRFLQRHVLAPNAPLRVGRDGFELAEPIARGLMLAACWAGDGAQVLAEARRATSPTDGALRAAGALWLLFHTPELPPLSAERLAEARRLIGDAPPGDFLRAFLLAEIAGRGDDAEAALAARTLAGKFVKTADQHEALQSQGRRLSR